MPITASHTGHTSMKLTVPAKQCLMAIFLLGNCIFSSKALALCTSEGILELPITKDIFNRGWTSEIDSSLPIGSVLDTFQLQTDAAFQGKVTCTGDLPIIRVTATFPIYSGNIYQTGIPGIGITITANFNGQGPLPNEYSKTEHTFQLSTYEHYFIQLIKIGYIPAGGQIFSHSLLQGHIINHDNLLIVNSELSQPWKVILKRPTCAVTTPNFTVNLGDISITDFHADGRTKPKNFNIDLDCTGGTNSADIYVTLTDASNPGNSSSQLNLSPDSGAQGIALEVNNRYGTVNFGPDLEGIGNPGQWLDGTTGIGSYSIPLSVNYIRLPGPIKAGTANAGVTYTLNYD